MLQVDFLAAYFGGLGARIWDLSGGPVRCNTGPGLGQSSYLTNLTNVIGFEARFKEAFSSKIENVRLAPHAHIVDFSKNLRAHSERTVILSLKLSKS